MTKKTMETEKFFVNITESAENDLDDLIMFIAQNNPQNAMRIMDRIKARIKTLENFPQKGAYVPELLAKNIKDYKQITEPPWKIVYKIDGKFVNILTIVDSRRNLQDILVKKLLG